MQRFGALFYGKVQALSRCQLGELITHYFLLAPVLPPPLREGTRKKNDFKDNGRLNKEGGLDFKALVCANANSHEIHTHACPRYTERSLSC